MNTTSETRTTGTSMTAAKTGDPAYQAYRILQAGFIAAPILAGLDKFFNILVNWEIPRALRRKPDRPWSLYGRCRGSRDRRRHRGGYQATDFRLRRRSLARGHHSQLAYTSGLLRRSAARSGPRPRRAGTRPTQSEVRSPLERELIVTRKTSAATAREESNEQCH